MNWLGRLRSIFSDGGQNVLPLTATPIDKALATGLKLLQSGQGKKAQEHFEAVLVREPDNARALHSLGILAAQAGDFSQAAELIGRAAEVGAHDAEVFSNLGNALRHLGRLEEAMCSYDRALSADGNYAYAYFNKAQLCLQRHDSQNALTAMQGFLERIPGHAEGWLLLGDILISLKRQDEALACYGKSILLESSFVAHMNRGSTLERLCRYDEAVADFRQAQTIEPENFLPYYNLGATLLKVSRIEDAIAALDEAIRLNPRNALAYHCRANALNKKRSYREALEDYRRACQFGTGVQASPAMLLYTQLKICDWAEYAALREQVLDGISRGEAGGRPFPVLALSAELTVQRGVADIFSGNIRSEIPQMPPIKRYPAHDRVRIGYFSADLRNHPVTYLTAELFELHDHEHFEITAFSFGHYYDDMTRRVNEVVDDYIDCRTLSDEDVVNLARTLEIDIAIDLGGYTESNRANLFAMRVAPIQVSYLGFPGTMGEGMHDYLFADHILVPLEQERWYAEKIVYLPVYQVNDSKRAIAERIFSRAELNLPETGFVYCCFNNPVKYNPAMFDVWADILCHVEDSVLFLLADNEDATRNIIAEFSARGVTSERIVLGDRLPRADYLARYRTCDLFLDTLPFNAGTTASDALWAGLPVLTCAGEAFASRMAASLLSALQLSELIASSLDDYRRLAIDLARPDSVLAELRARLARSLKKELLFDSSSVTRHIETAYLTMYERYRNDSPPISFQVES